MSIRSRMPLLLVFLLGVLLASVTFLALLLTRSGSSRYASGLEDPERERVAVRDQFHTAYHEAGHAVVGEALLPKREFQKLEVFSRVSEGKYWGMVYWNDDGVEGDEVYWHRAIAMTALAGGATEEVFYKKNPRQDDPDADQAAFESLAYCEMTACACPAESRVGDECLLDGVLSQRSVLYEQTKVCVEANKQTIAKLGKLVMKKREDGRRAVRTLSKHELDAFFAEHPLDVEACLETNSSPLPLVFPRAAAQEASFP